MIDYHMPIVVLHDVHTGQVDSNDDTMCNMRT